LLCFLLALFFCGKERANARKQEERGGRRQGEKAQAQAAAAAAAEQQQQQQQGRPRTARLLEVYLYVYAVISKTKRGQAWATLLVLGQAWATLLVLAQARNALPKLAQLNLTWAATAGRVHLSLKTRGRARLLGVFL
jgi:hypothetical protein